MMECHGVAYSLLWKMLDKKGNSDSDERMNLLDRFQKIFPETQIADLCGEREFLGQKWLSSLLIQHDNFFQNIALLTLYTLYLIQFTQGRVAESVDAPHSKCGEKS